MKDEYQITDEGKEFDDKSIIFFHHASFWAMILDLVNIVIDITQNMPIKFLVDYACFSIVFCVCIFNYEEYKRILIFKLLRSLQSVGRI